MAPCSPANHTAALNCGFVSPYAPQPQPAPCGPLDDIPADRRLPQDHPLAQLTAKAATDKGLDDREWQALAPKLIREHGTQISQLRRRVKAYRADCHRAGKTPDPEHLNNLRDEVLAHFARVIPAAQKPVDSPLGQFLTQMLHQPPRPATGARDFKKVFREKFGHDLGDPI